MSFYIHIQETPNPHAVKFISRYTVRTEGKSNYHNRDEAQSNPLAQRIFDVGGVVQVFFFDNYITVTKDPTVEWTGLAEEIVDLLQEQLPDHNPNYVDEREEAKVSREDLPPEIREIEEVLDRTIRPALAADGGGLEVVERRDGVVYIRYQGACGSCPSSVGGTLIAIQSILRDEIDRDLEVVDVGGGAGAGGGWW